MERKYPHYSISLCSEVRDSVFLTTPFFQKSPYRCFLQGKNRYSLRTKVFASSLSLSVSLYDSGKLPVLKEGVRYQAAFPDGEDTGDEPDERAVSVDQFASTGLRRSGGLVW